MVGRRWTAAQPWKLMQKPLALGLALQILWGSGSGSAIAATTSISSSGQLTETAAPRAFSTLGRVLDQYQPQIKILSPKAGELLTDNSVNVTFDVKDLPIYKDKTLQLGPHLHLQLDDRPHQSIYNPTESVLLNDLQPGTHTLRLFATRPWDESFKNDGSFAQVTFHIFTKTDDNQPKTNQPLLTYNQPQGTYGAQPILLDFYLTNAPLHLIAQENDSDNIQDWKIKATVNGQSFLLDRWQPTYLTGFKPGKNWVQLEFIDQNGNRVENFGNNTARIFTYEPNGQDPLAQLTRGELTIAQSKGIVDPSYTPPAPPKPLAKPSLSGIEPPIEAAPAEPKVEIKSEAKPEVKPEVKPVPAAESVKPVVPIVPIVPIIPIPLPQKAPDLKAPIEPKPEVKSEIKPEKATEAQPRTRKIIQKLLPAFMGPGKKIDVKTPTSAAAPTAIAPVKPANQPPATKPVDPKPTATKPVEAKSVEKNSDEPKKGNWLDRFRKPAKDENTTSETKPETKPAAKSNSKPEAKTTETNEESKPDSSKPIAIPNNLSSPLKGISIPAISLPSFFQKATTPTPQISTPADKPTESEPTESKPIQSKSAEPKLTETKNLNSNAQKKPAIEARKPFKFNFGSNKKTENKIVPNPNPTPTAQPIPQIAPKPASIPTKTSEINEPQSSNWLDRFRKPTAEKAESKPAAIKSVEIKPLAKPSATEIVKPTETKALQPKQLQTEPLKKEPQKVPAIIPSRSEPAKPLQFTPGKKVEVKTPIKPQPKPEIKSEIKPQALPQLKPEIKQTFKPQPKPEVKLPVKPEPKTPEIKPSPAPQNQTSNPDSKPINDLKEINKPTPIKSIPLKSVPTITPKSTPQNTIKPLAKPPLGIVPTAPLTAKPTEKTTAKPTEKIEEKPSPKTPETNQDPNKYDYLKEYLNNPTQKTETPTETKSR